MSKPNGLKPGQTAPASGQYQTIGPKGGKGNEVTVTKGEPLYWFAVKWNARPWR
jgi:hypothetical protein